MVDGVSKSPQCLFPHLWLQLTLPHSNAVPPHLCQFPLLFLVPFLIPLNLFLPKVRIRLGHPEVLTTIMPVPKATIDKYTSAILAQYYIRVTGEAWIVQPVAESLLPQIFAYKYLRLRVRRANRRAHMQSSVDGLPKNLEYPVHEERCILGTVALC